MTPNRPAISIIVNAYNGAAFLAEALDSVLAQTWTDWELVFWDDQSTDDTAAIFRGYDDPRFRYFHAPEYAPLGRARSQAVEQARGEWLAFLDQDDAWTPDKLETQMALAGAPGDDGPALIYGRALYLYPGGRTKPHDHRHEYRRLPEGEIFDDLFTDACFIVMSTLLVKRSAYDEVGGVPPGYDLIVDYALFLALARRFKAAAVQHPCCWYRKHDSNVSWTRRMECLREIIRILESWAPEVGPDMVRRPLAVHETLLGLDEILAGRPLTGVARILKRGSPAYLLSRPFARAWRNGRRVVRPSPWNRPPPLPRPPGEDTT